MSSKETLFYYSTHRRNFGDALNWYLMERILQIPVKKVSWQAAEMVGVGSLLQKYAVSKYNIPARIAGAFHAPVTVMSSGFIRSVPEHYTLNRRLEVKALRGHESRKIIERLNGKVCDAAVGDGGLLYPLLLEKPMAKRFTLGIVPHCRDFDLPAVQQIAGRFDRTTVINVLDEPLEVLKRIAECEFILSSSLHGLIVADAMNIPNRHILLSDNVTGDGFKFKDYYSVFEQLAIPEALTADAVMQSSVKELFEAYPEKTAEIARLQSGLLQAMKF